MVTRKKRRIRFVSRRIKQRRTTGGITLRTGQSAVITNRGRIVSGSGVRSRNIRVSEQLTPVPSTNVMTDVPTTTVTTPTRLQGTVRPFVTGRTIIERRQQTLSLRRSELETRQARGGLSLGGRAELTGLGFALGGVGALRFGQELVRSPEETVRGVPAAFGRERARITGGEFAREVRSSPSFFVGSAAFEIAALRGGGAIAAQAPARIGGALTRATPGFRPVQTIDRFGVPERRIAAQPEPIGIIPEGSPPTPRGVSRRQLPATVKGGFRTTEAERAASFGTPGIVTSQRGIFGRFRRRASVIDNPVDPGFGLFATPRSVVTGELETRASRLGSFPRQPNLLEFMSGDVRVISPQPQILVFPRERVGARGRFETFGKPGRELEVATLGPSFGGPSEITGQPLGRTVIGGRSVRIIETSFTGPQGRGRTGVSGILDTPSTTRRGRTSRSSRVSDDLVVRPTPAVGASGTARSFLFSGASVRRPTTTPGPVATPSQGVPRGGGFSGASFTPGPSFSIIGPPPAIPGPRRGPPPFRFRLPRIGVAGVRREPVRGRREFARTPSLVAIELGITAPRRARGEETGLVARPVLS